MGTQPSRHGELARDARGGAWGTALLLLQVWGFFTAYSVSESTGSSKNFWGMFVQAVDPGRNASPSWRAEAWDLNPALCSCCWAAPREQGLVVLDSQSEVPKAALDSTGSFSGYADLTPLVLCNS